ncbi:hypothetical protein [Nostoc sp. ATCC 53789]|uniref:hypothetical protein n=1 Tax=Nostoc sp. ATCC 53789 TaxID=76335 RepID=UPI0011BD9FA1|nr:hypothetical protein [Nostoc sp. ATCC 53789]QHG14699.1 hypothetical protein GJB62_00925 [Nostoc sp. ATCC 53789]
MISPKSVYADSDQRESRSLADDIKLAIAFFWSGERKIQALYLSPFPQNPKSIEFLQRSHFPQF